MIFALAVTGPTASGKTSLSLGLSERLSGEIISSDSMQIYKYMDIGTAKATIEEQMRAPHHMIDFLSPTENYSVEAYRAEALKIAREIETRGKLPIFVGGTGLYLDSLLRAPQIGAPESDPAYRASILENIRDDSDVEKLWERLNSVDPESASEIHKNNVKRVIRALEIYDKTGIKKSELDRRSRECAKDIHVGIITLDFHSRDTLYERVDLRVDMMMEEGLLDEVRSLYERGLLRPDTTAAQAIGYKEIVAHLEGRCSLEESIDMIKLSSRRYAKRQLTWFRHCDGAIRIYCDGEDGVMRSGDEILSDAIGVYRAFRADYEREYR